MVAQARLFFWDVREEEFRLVDMSPDGLGGPENELWSDALTTTDVINESWSSLGFLVASVVPGWAKREVKPYKEMSSPTQPIYSSYHWSQQTVMISKGLQLFTFQSCLSQN